MPGQAVPPPDLALLLSQASHALTTELTDPLAELGITPRSLSVLRNAMSGARTQRQLAALTGLDKTTMVATIDQLEQAGLAERRPSRTDRRARIIEVTPAGRQVVAAGNAISDRIYADVLAALPARERHAFVAALVRLVNGRLSTPVPCGQPVRRRAERRLRSM